MTLARFSVFWRLEVLDRLIYDQKGGTVTFLYRKLLIRVLVLLKERDKRDLLSVV